MIKFKSILTGLSLSGVLLGGALHAGDAQGEDNDYGGHSREWSGVNTWEAVVEHSKQFKD